jgi:DNA-directed RNA polymerase alpha subunit
MHYICRKCATRLGSPEDLKEHNAISHGIGEVEIVLNSQGDDFIPLARVDDDLAELLKVAGFNTYGDIVSATLKQLTVIKGIGDATAKAIKASAEELLNASDEQGTQGVDEEV